MTLRDRYQASDMVSVNWNLGKRGVKLLYPMLGVVVQVTDRLVAIRCPANYVFCVSDRDMAAGVQVKVKSQQEKVAV